MALDIKSEIASLFNQHADYLFNFAITRVNDEHIAEDLVQETFISALRNYASFEGKSKASTWLIAILKNKIIDHYRKKVREYKKESIDQLASTEDFFNTKGHWRKEQRPQAVDFSADQSLNQEEFYVVLQKCLTGLNDLQRMAFVLKHLEDVDTTEICKELQITASNYWVIIHRAKLQLRKCLEINWINV
ncbi:MAG: sigma-70 family RNA polymerase sigma factor [Bacteroidales bacterium]|nr:sigma-70 family RNA polymerase sigma factor [Bacteroidales bacterium]MCF8404436.1 sigma-70 family RNA polymerase sigma factor [Bacteroidales bacterium]